MGEGKVGCCLRELMHRVIAYGIFQRKSKSRKRRGMGLDYRMFSFGKSIMAMRSGRPHLDIALCALVGSIVIILAAVLPALASPQVTIGNPGLEHFDSDGGVELDFGLTDPGGQPVGNLRPENLKGYEDGGLAKGLDFR